jgi:hypothetical protein
LAHELGQKSRRHRDNETVHRIPVEQVQVAGQINNNNSISVVVFHGFYGFDIELCHEDAKRITDGLSKALEKLKATH